MRVAVVTGGSGFIGSHLIDLLLKNDYEVHNVDKLTYAADMQWTVEQTHKHYHFHRVDICDEEAMSKLMFDVQPDVVFHAAAETHVDTSIENPDIFIQTNVVGTLSVLKAAKDYYEIFGNKKKFRFVHISTDEVFGTLGINKKFNENSPYLPNSPYSASKASSDLLVRSFRETYKLPAVITNCTNNFGPRQNTEKLIPKAINCLLSGEKIPVYGHGTNIRDWLFVSDHCHALMLVAEHREPKDRYVIGGYGEASNLEVIKMLCQILEKPYDGAVKFVENRKGHDFRYAVDPTRAYTHLGWRPERDLFSNLRTTVEWYRTIHDLSPYRLVPCDC